MGIKTSIKVNAERAFKLFGKKNPFVPIHFQIGTYAKVTGKYLFIYYTKAG